MAEMSLSRSAAELQRLHTESVNDIGVDLVAPNSAEAECASEVSAGSTNGPVRISHSPLRGESWTESLAIGRFKL